jgi:hypothetical protein
VIKDDEDRHRHILENMLYLSEINPYLCYCALKQGFINVIEGDYLKYKTKMKFDAILGNPPYTVGKNKTIWHLFVEKSFELCGDNGYVSLVHPNGWRNIGGRFSKTQNLIKSKKVLYLSMNNIIEGRRIFNVDTPFDWYVINNTENNNNSLTKIKFQDGLVDEIRLNEFDFIPNFQLDEIKNLIAKENEEKVCVLHSESLYEIRQNHMSAIQSNEYYLPCVYSVLKNGSPTLKYSREDRGYFGIPKIILGNGANPTSFIDYNGDYGMTQFAFAIVDDVDNLEKIKKALNSDKFAKITEATKYVATAGNPLVYPKILKAFRKDFWKDFIDE